MIVANFANSAGWMVIGPNRYQPWVPFTVAPSGVSTPSMATSEAP